MVLLQHALQPCSVERPSFSHSPGKTSAENLSTTQGGGSGAQSGKKQPGCFGGFLCLTLSEGDAQVAVHIRACVFAASQFCFPRILYNYVSSLAWSGILHLASL